MAHRVGIACLPLMLGAAAALAGCVGDDADTSAQADQNAGASVVSSISEGDFIIRSVATNKCIDISNSSKDDGGKVQEWDCNGSSAQTFHLSTTSNGYYKIINVNSNKALDITDASTAENAVVHQWTYVDGANQQFKFDNRGGNNFSITARHSGMVLDLSYGAADNGTTILQYPYHGTNNQLWTFDKVAGVGGSLPAPPATWQEHWFEHNQLLSLGSYNDTVALYFDKDVNRAGTEWILPFATNVWQYTTKTYGSFGKDRLYMIFHQGKYGGGHPSTYLDASHDFRNVSDVGPGPWDQHPGVYSISTHEVSHIVELATNGVHGSPAFGLWGDSKWAEFYQYDLYVALGLTTDAQSAYNDFMGKSDSFPRDGTHWFRDWFYPLWRDHGHAQVMVNYFKLLSQYYPHPGNNYPGMNWGEYIHFMSGAAKTNLQPMASKAFGWPSDWQAQFTKARSDFPGITY